MEKVSIELVSEKQHLVLNPLTGKKTIVKTPELFGFISREFYSSPHQVGAFTPKRTIKVFDVTLDEGASLANLFEAFPGLWSSKWLSQSQITKVCKHFRSWFQLDEQPNLFLCKKNEFAYVTEKNPWKNLQIIEIIVDDDNKLSIRIIPEIVLLSPKIQKNIFRVIMPAYRKIKK
jgi:hypothetical protein